MLCDVVAQLRRWAHMPVIHATNHFDHKKRVAWIPIPMHTCGSISIIMELRLVTLRAARAPLSRDPLTNITGPYHGLRFKAHQGCVFF